MQDTFDFEASESQDKEEDDSAMVFPSMNTIKGDKSNSIKPFTGSANSQETFEEWIQKFEDWIKSSETNEEDRSEQLREKRNIDLH